MFGRKCIYVSVFMLFFSFLHIAKAENTERLLVCDTLKYTVHPLSFESVDRKYVLEGECLIPDGRIKNNELVILISPPSFPFNRSYHGVFDSIGAYLASSGTAVFRFDNRNYKYKDICGNCFSMYDQASDIRAAINAIRNFKETKNLNIGLLGHSEGGCVATIAAADNVDVSFCVLLSTSGVPGDKLMLSQLRIPIYADTSSSAAFKSRRLAFFENIVSIIKNSSSIDESRTSLRKFLMQTFTEHPDLKTLWRMLPESTVANIYIDDWLRPRLIQYIKYDPGEKIKKVKCPILLVSGGMDEKIDSNSNTLKLRTVLEGNEKATMVHIDSMNHDLEKVTFPKHNKSPDKKNFIIYRELLNVVKQWLNEKGN